MLKYSIKALKCLTLGMPDVKNRAYCSENGPSPKVGIKIISVYEVHELRFMNQGTETKT